MRPSDCGIQIVRDREVYLCGRLGSEVCSDCGTMLCRVSRRDLRILPERLLRLLPLFSCEGTASRESMSVKLFPSIGEAPNEERQRILAPTRHDSQVDIGSASASIFNKPTVAFGM